MISFYLMSAYPFFSMYGCLRNFSFDIEGSNRSTNGRQRAIGQPACATDDHGSRYVCAGDRDLTTEMSVSFVPHLSGKTTVVGPLLTLILADSEAVVLQVRSVDC